MAVCHEQVQTFSHCILEQEHGMEVRRAPSVVPSRTLLFSSFRSPSCVLNIFREHLGSSFYVCAAENVNYKCFQERKCLVIYSD